MRLKDKVAIVTGAGSGNGAAIATGFLAEGAKVVFADINIDNAIKVAEGSGSEKENWLAAEVDVANADSIDQLVEKTLEAFSKIDILVANAGITIKRSFLEMTEEEYDKVMEVNAKGVFLSSQRGARVMAEQGSGSIIHTSSTTSVIAEANAVQYGASKGAVAAMTRHMALELGDKNIRVNAIAPGTILTNLTNARLQDEAILAKEAGLTMLNRVGKPNDVLGAVVFLASDESSFITGTHLFIDGGYSVI